MHSVRIRCVFVVKQNTMNLMQDYPSYLSCRDPLELPTSVRIKLTSSAKAPVATAVSVWKRCMNKKVSVGSFSVYITLKGCLCIILKAMHSGKSRKETWKVQKSKGEKKVVWVHEAWEGKRRLRQELSVKEKSEESDWSQWLSLCMTCFAKIPIPSCLWLPLQERTPKEHFSFSVKSRLEDMKDRKTCRTLCILSFMKSYLIKELLSLVKDMSHFRQL